MEIYHHRQTKSHRVASRTHLTNYHLDHSESAFVLTIQFDFQFHLFPHRLDFSYRQMLAMDFSVWLYALRLLHTRGLGQLRKPLLHHLPLIICLFQSPREWPDFVSRTSI